MPLENRAHFLHIFTGFQFIHRHFCKSDYSPCIFYLRFSVLETVRFNVARRVATASQPVDGSVGSHTMINPHHLYCFFPARREELQKFVTNCKAARNSSELLEQFVSKRQLLLSLSAVVFLAHHCFSRGIKANKAPNLKPFFVAVL